MRIFDRRFSLVSLLLMVVIWSGFSASPSAPAEKTSGTIGARAETPNTEASANRGPSKGYIECSGKVHPHRYFLLRLRPGERIVGYMVQEGQKVEKGTPLVQLSNDNLSGEIEALQEKEIEIEESRDQAELLRLKIGITEESLQRLKARIDAERKIMNEIPGYLIEGKAKEWTSEVAQKEDTLVIMRKELSLLEKRIRRTELLKNKRITRMAALNKDLGNLLVRAPFSGQVKKTMTAFQYAAPGDLVLELWDTSVLEVEAFVWQHQLRYITIGGKVKILPDYFKETFVWGTIRSIGHPKSSMKEEGFPTFPVTIDVSENKVGLIAGMAVTVRVIQSKDAREK
jgi:multidrug efflux pump subunit AcrA (membrane-fusion protein)